MIILGLHFGHDSSITVLKNGKILACVELERKYRIKHLIGLTYKDIMEVLNSLKIHPKNIDFCSVTSTQEVEYIFFEPKKLSFKVKSEYYSKKKYLLNLYKEKKNHPYVRRLIKKKFNLNKVKFIPSIENFYTSKKWEKGATLNQFEKFFLKNDFKDLDERYMQVPIQLKLNNIYIEGFLMSHHYAHASYAYYTSGFNNAQILTQDGSLPNTSYLSGMCYYGKKNRLYPVIPHYLNLGRIYETISEVIGFDRDSGPGKMMGLAPYGKPVFFKKKFIGNFFDYKNIKVSKFKLKKLNIRLKKKDICSIKWLSHCLNIAKKKKYDFSPIGNLKKILYPINVDLASSTQMLLEETMSKCIKKMKTIYKKNNFYSSNLCLAGGTMLNCPSNSKIYNKKLFKNIFVPPAVHDGGLSIGSTLAVYYNHKQKKRKINYGNDTSLAYLGLKSNKKTLTKTLKNFKSRIIYKRIKNHTKKIAQLISKNKIVCIFTGSSEIGPRALGNRSILADPRFKNNWKKVNIIKKRETWRPFAPVIIDKYFSSYFTSSPKTTPFMLFTSKVKNKKIPAITHVDNSSRVQTISNKSLQIYKILKNFKNFTGIPILLNTSFNGPGEPIVESYKEALNFFLKSDVDALNIENFEILKR